MERDDYDGLVRRVDGIASHSKRFFGDVSTWIVLLRPVNLNMVRLWLRFYLRREITWTKSDLPPVVLEVIAISWHLYTSLETPRLPPWTSAPAGSSGGLQDLAESSNAGVVFFKCELTPISYPHEGGQSTAVPEAVAKEPEKTRTSTVLSWVGETGEILADYPKKFGPIEGSLWGSVDGKYPWKNYLSKYFKTWMLRR